MTDPHDTTNAALFARAERLFIPNYKPAQLVIERGRGAWVFDVEGRRYLDLVGGIAVSALGHGHPRVVAAVKEQAEKVLHTSNLYLNRPAIELARRVLASTPALEGYRIFFCNSGAEANEAQLKLARRVAHDRGEKARVKVVAFEQSFHGRTYGALAATGQPKYHEGFGPMPGGMVHVPYGDAGALAAAVDRETAAILIEPIQGEGGVRVAPPGFLAECRRLADAAGALLLLDEVQCGVGRTGRMFAFEHEGVRPDIMALAKGLGGGLPLGAIVAREDVAAHLTYGTHGTTFGGNPVACAAGAVIFDALAEPGMLAHVERMGARISDGLRGITSRTGAFSDVRHRGLLIGAELAPAVRFDAKMIVDRCRDRGVLVHVAGPRVLRLAPPLILSEAEADHGVEVISAVVGELSQP